MAVVIAALLPVFILIVLGVVLRHSLMRLDTQWHGLERLTYFVLFPMLLIQTLVKADLTKVPVAGVGGALLLSALAMSLLCLALRPALSRLDIDGPAFTSIFQGATRWQTYVALSVSANLYGDVGLALASVAMVAIIPLVNVFSVAVLAHYASPEKQSARAIVMTVIRNPLIWACVIGLVINVIHLPLPKIWHEVADALGRSSLAIGLLVTGAGLQLKGLLRPSLGATLGVTFKLVLMPVLALALAVWFGLSGDQPRDRRDLRGGADLAERLCAGPPDGRRCAAAGADHHAADDFGGDHDADRDRAGGLELVIARSSDEAIQTATVESICRDKIAKQFCADATKQSRLPPRRKSGLLRFARNDGTWSDCRPSSPATSSAPPPSCCSAHAARW